MKAPLYCRLFYRVPFSETDAMGIVHHSNHARYLERGRVEYLRLVGMEYTDVVKMGFHFPLTEMRMEFKKPLVFNEIIVVETRLTKLSKVRLTFSYRIHRATELEHSSLASEPFSAEKPSLLGETLHCCVNLEGRPEEMPAGLFGRLGPLETL